MFQKTNIQINGILSSNDKITLETEIDVLPGVIEVIFNDKTNKLSVEFDDKEISDTQIQQKIKELNYQTATQTNQSVPATREHTYFIQGMHCASCEILIEKKLLEFPGIKAVEASTKNGEALIEYKGDRPRVETLNKVFKKSNYFFSDQPLKEKKSSGSSIGGPIFIALLLILGFLVLNKSGLSDLVNVTSSSSLPLFFAFGLLAGISSCAALVGGIILSMSKQWSDLYSSDASTWQKMKPHLMFNFGRLVSYGILGGILGLIGSKLQLSLEFSSLLVIAVSALMILLSLQMLGVKGFSRFQITAPKFITRYLSDETNFSGRYMPFGMGAATFFLPCGFTITAQGLALLSGNFVQGGLIMISFALGTLLPLLAIGFSSVKLSQNPRWSERFLKIAGIVVLFFALFNINAQLKVLGFNFSGSVINSSVGATNSVSEEGLPSIINGKQILKMEASSRGYAPNNLKVRLGMPVRWEITDTGTSGCTNAIISRSLFDGQISLTPGQVAIKEFTPTKAGKYVFSCWMGMISGIIEVVNTKTASAGLSNPTGSAALAESTPIPSGAKGCGCGGGGSGSCSAPK
jgi:sulfite exporter TauE/SafE/copper chaperone CopZ